MNCEQLLVMSISIAYMIPYQKILIPKFVFIVVVLGSDQNNWIFWQNQRSDKWAIHFLAGVQSVRREGRSPLPLLWKLKDFHLWVKFLIWNAVLRVSRRKDFGAGAFLLSVVQEIIMEVPLFQQTSPALTNI